MTQYILLRILIDIFIFIGIFVWPWWLTLFVIILCGGYFRFFIEGVFIGIFLDLLFATPARFVFDIQFVMTGLSLGVVLSAEYIKKYIRK